MILDSKGSTVQSGGDIAEHQISVDPKNLEHIISILSTNLYSKPEQSFLREIVCNAIDAQVEAKSEEPAIITFMHDAQDNNVIIAIRDYGTGISPKRFQEIYLNIGSSTKRESNDYIGSFGIGRFSALACASMVHITSYYEGKEYHYIMLKNASKVNIDLIDVNDTNEPNGVEVKIKVDNVKNYVQSLRYLWFIPNVYVNNVSVTAWWGQFDAFNQRVLMHAKTFAFNNAGLPTGLYVLHGNILYRVDNEQVPKFVTENSEDLEEIYQKVIPKFNIGELEVTPNREQLLYSDKTLKALAEKYELVHDEVVELIQSKSQKVYNNIFEYYDEVDTTAIDITIFNTDKEYAWFSISKRSTFYPLLSFRYRNMPPMWIDKDISTEISNLESYGITAFRNATVFKDNTFASKKSLRWSGRMKTLLDESNDVRIFFVPSMENLKGEVAKEYFKQKAAQFKKYPIFVFTTDSPDLKKFIHIDGFHVHGTGYNVVDKEKSLWLLCEILRIIKKKIFVYDVAHSKDFLAFKKDFLAERRETRKQNVGFAKHVRFYLQPYKKDDCRERHDYTDVKDTNSLVEYVNKVATNTLNAKKTIPVYWAMDGDPYIMILRKLLYRRRSFIIVTAAKTNFKYLDKADFPPNWIKLTPQVILNHHEWAKAMTRQKFGAHLSDMSSQLMYLMYETPPFEILRANSYTNNLDSIGYSKEYDALKANYTGPYNTELIEGYRQIDRLNQMVYKMRPVLRLSGGQVNVLTLYAAMKRKLYRPNWRVYERIIKSFNPELLKTDKDEETSVE